MKQRRDLPTNNGSLDLKGRSLHEAVRAEISRRVASGVYKPGEVIGSTAQLGEEFKVSPITVKRAVRDLQSAGVLTSVPGKGTFVKTQQRIVVELDSGPMSSADSLRQLGAQTRIELVSITKETISDPALGVFDLPSVPQLCVRKIIYVDETAVMYDATYVSPRVPNVIIQEFGEVYVTEALRRHNVELTSQKLVIDAAPASPGAQHAFSIPSGYPMLRRLYHVQTNRPGITVIGVVESPFDRLVCSVDMPIRKVPRAQRA